MNVNDAKIVGTLDFPQVSVHWLLRNDFVGLLIFKSIFPQCILRSIWFPSVSLIAFGVGDFDGRWMRGCLSFH